MGKPQEAKAAKVSENYNWGNFGSADASGTTLSDASSQILDTARQGTQSYLQELLNPSYSSESFKARQALIDQQNQQYANELAANAIERGARGSTTQNILASIAANRENQMREAMTTEDQRISNILSQLGTYEDRYFNQANTMANNILQRVSANQQAQNQVNIANAQAQNQYRNNLISGAAALGGAALGAATGGLGTLATSGLTSSLLKQAALSGSAIDPMQALSASNSF